MSRISFGTTSGAIRYNSTASAVRFYPDTIAPTISDGRIYQSGGVYYCEWKVRNNDPVDATITSEFNDSTPDEFVVNLNYNVLSTFITQNLGAFAVDGTIYAFAQATGKGPSNYVSLFVAI
jgi:hypothetical protein